MTFAREGADLVLNTGSSRAELEEVAAQCRELGVRTHTAICDVSDAKGVYRMVADGTEALGTIDVLVSNVAIRPHKPILEVSEDEWQHVFAVNLDSAFYLCKAVLPGVMERRSGNTPSGTRNLKESELGGRRSTCKTYPWGVRLLLRT